MANFTGNYNVDTTINNGDSVTGNVTINTSKTLTIAVGATVNFTGSYSITAGSTTAGTIYCVGTEASPIILKSSLADPTSSDWGSLAWGVTGSTINCQYTKIQSATYGINLRTDLATINATYNHIWLDKCATPIDESATHTNARSYTIQNIIISGGAANGVILDMDNTASATTYQNIYITELTNASIGTLNGTTLTKIVANGNTTSGLLSVINSTGTGFTLSESYFTGTYASVMNILAASWTITINNNVFYDTVLGTQEAGIKVGGNSTVNTNNNDFISCGNQTNSGAIYRNATGTISSTSDYVAGCTTRPVTIVDTTANTQVIGVGASFTRTTPMATPNKPLTVDNVSVGTPTTTGVTMTFDCAAGTGTVRCHGIGYVRYGTTSGAYTMSTVHDNISEPIELGKYWTGWSTKYSFLQTGHSVTLSNLTSGTKYYYQCCFVDPLGRIGVSAEGNFTTATTALTFTAKQSDNYAPSNYTTNITLSCTVAGASQVTATINSKTIRLTNTSGNNYSVTTYAGYFGAGSGKTIYFEASDLAGAYGTTTAASTITIPAVTTKTGTLLTEMSASLVSAGYTPTLSLLTEKQSGSNIISLVQISVPTYAVATLDGIRTTVAASYSGWTNVSSAVESAAPASSTSSIIIYKITHT